MLLIYFVASLVIIAIVWGLVNTRLQMPENARAIVNVVLTLIVVGMGLWLVNTYVPMAGSIKVILNIVVVVACCIGVLQAVGLWDQVVRLWQNLSYKISH